MAAIPPDQDRGPADKPAATGARPDRAEILAVALAGEGLTGEERSRAEVELRAGLRDAPPALRRSIADYLKCSPHAPRGVLFALIDDHNFVSLPILEHSPVLEEADLVRLAATATAARRAAMARRASIARAPAEALVENADAGAVAALLADRGSDYSEPMLTACLDRWPNSEAVHRALIERARLPLALALRLMALVCDELGELLVARHPVSRLPDSEIIELTRNRPVWWAQQISGYFS